MTYRTKNQSIAPYLLALKNLGKIQMTKYARNDRDELEIEFEPRAACELALEQFYSGTAEWIPPKVLMDAVSEWKQLIRLTGKQGYI